ncbi:fzo-like conserved region domain-containing protein [Ditylenchus destructor]|uniref:Fzo-like conserved region domain-containing protein n=1 Tax=Ditylenchus destructor TaxID=166010 RepID=A0AAD4MP91_9BILA|nr:fzo-like conserved region domain-containing protein [Ditylenchus destructor]
MAGTVGHIHGNGDRTGAARRGNSNEPLLRFSEAKNHMSKIYNNLGEDVDELHKFYYGIDVEDKQKFLPEKSITEVEQFKDSIRTIKDMFGRDKMKVVFFGRTSNGKSTAINAMLHSHVLPTGIGHTTCCFLQVEGGSENDTYFMVEGSNEKTPIAELEQAGDALHIKNVHGAAMGADSLLKVFYPKANSKLLQNDVVILDSPGIDVSKEFDSWIDKHCLDADVFVLVCNAESTLSNAEKQFFHRVNSKLSRPNVFIINNRWEISNRESEPRRQKLLEQHQSQFVKFLSQELKLCTPNESKERIFFVSAMEMLDYRCRPKDAKSAALNEGFQERKMAFEKFETNFEKCISKSAIRTKFEAHSRRATEIIENTRHNIESVINGALHERQRQSLDHQLKQQEFLTSREKFRIFEQKYYADQKKVRAEVHLKVSADFHEEILRLESIFDRFNCKFSDDSEDIAYYKKALAEFVGNVVTSDLENQCTGGLVARIWKLENAMLSDVKDIMGDKYDHEFDKFWRYNKPFKFAITVDCPSMVRDFHEDLEFRFSLGIESIARRVLSITRGQPVTAIGHDVVRFGNDARQVEKNDVDTLITKVLVQGATYLANGSVGIALAGLIIYKNVDWRYIGAAASGIGLLYAYERYKWNAGAKEERLKDQFRSHLEQRLQQVEHIHTHQCEAQVVTELTKVYDGLRTTVSAIHGEQKKQIDRMKTNTERIEKVEKELSNRTAFVKSELESFATRFLSPDSP